MLYTFATKIKRESVFQCRTPISCIKMHYNFTLGGDKVRQETPILRRTCFVFVKQDVINTFVA